jgi:hypothetical protein
MVVSFIALEHPPVDKTCPCGNMPFKGVDQKLYKNTIGRAIALPTALLMQDMLDKIVQLVDGGIVRFVNPLDK